jgi:predicted DNA-binding transcriptional regulator AlpA
MSMKLDPMGFSSRSKIVPSIAGVTPVIERTEGEKIALARKFLEKRSFVVLTSLVTRADVAAYLGCSVSSLMRIIEQGVFPTPYNIAASKSSIRARNTPRWKVEDITKWLESTKNDR